MNGLTYYRTKDDVISLNKDSREERNLFVVYTNLVTMKRTLELRVFLRNNKKIGGGGSSTQRYIKRS